MSDTWVSLLTPPGAGAIATVEVRGPSAWPIARELFRPAGKPLPEQPVLHRFWFGRLGDAGDEVILAVKAVEHPAGRGVPGEGVVLELHCHGGRRVVRWVIEQFTARGCVESSRSGGRQLLSGGCQPPEFFALGGLTPPAPSAIDLLPHAPTLRTASILLDQHHGAFDRAVRHILDHIERAGPLLADLARFAPIGHHLVSPWRVVVAGPPNVGKSSLVNALAGYQRSVVSEVAGTTRDVVTVPVAFDGWPVELIDTAGLRAAAGLEAEGIDRAKQALVEADLVLWVMDEPHPPPSAALAVFNKCDLRPAPPGFVGVRTSALTGFGIAELVAAIVRRLVPHVPEPGAAVPYTPRLANLIEAARDALPTEAVAYLRAALATA